MTGKRRGLSTEEQEVRLRVGAYLRLEWEKYAKTAPEPTQDDFAKKVGIHFTTVSHILKSDDGAGFNVFIALQLRGVDATSMLRDPLPDKYYVAVPGDGRVERHARRHRRQVEQTRPHQPQVPAQGTPAAAEDGLAAPTPAHHPVTHVAVKKIVGRTAARRPAERRTKKSSL